MLSRLFSFGCIFCEIRKQSSDVASMIFFVFSSPFCHTTIRWAGDDVKVLPDFEVTFTRCRGAGVFKT
jgi:hypothetical protein